MAITPHRYQTLIYGDDRLNSTRKAICIRIAFAAVSTKDRFGWVEISHKCLGKDLAIKRENISRNLKWLIANGYLACHQPIAKGKFLTAQYRISGKAFQVTQDHTVHVTEGDTVHVTEGDTVHVTERSTSCAFPSQRERSELTATPPTQPTAEAEVSTEKELKGSAAPSPAQPRAAEPGAPETEAELLASMHSTRRYNGRDPSAVSHLEVDPAPPGTVDELGIHKLDDPVLAVPCPAPWCRARRFTKCKNPPALGYHDQRILAAGAAAKVSA